MQAHDLSSRWRAAVLLAAGTLALFALAACGSDDEAAPAAAPPTQATAPTVAPEPTATPAPAPPAAAVVPATAPEPGSDEEQIMAVLEKQIRAVHAADYVAFQETCTPSANNPPTVAQLKSVFEESGGSTMAGRSRLDNRFTPQGYNARNVEVKLLRAPFAQTELDVYDYDSYKFTGLRTWGKVDGQWYSETAPC